MLDGGSGSDTAGYNGEGGPIGVTANLATGTATDSFGDTDTLIGIENIRGSAHDDVLTGDSGANALAGNGGDDVLDGGAGNDTLIGGTGDDVYYVDSTGDGVFELAGQGSDEIRTTLASFTLGVTAQSANVEALTGLLDTGQALTGDDKDNVITGGGGDDVLTGGGSSGGDYLDGGAGDDRLVVSTGLNSIVHGGGGTDTMVVQLGDQSDDITLGAPSEDPDGGYTGELRGAGDTVSIFFDGVEKLDITTGSGNDSITAGGGDDVIATGAGDDVIDGGAGADTMTGGTGDDVYYVDNAGDVVVENAGEGTDEIRTTLASYTLTTANVEKLTYVGTGDFHGTGGGNADTITGGAGDDVLDGAGGNDFLDLSAGGTDRAIGGAGNDAVYFGAAFGAGDSVDGGTGTDTVGLRGDYTGANAATIVAGAMTGVEVLNLMTSTGGTVGYEITWDNGNLADGQKMTIYAGNLASGENVVFDGSAETHGYFVMYGGLGDDDLTGGANSDGFYFGPGKFDQNDHVDGGGGT
ncbi:MAG: calcium-binding protein, partial [Alphaproteobacteria bacterium]|nr:calcium-binding protein [Alphaproteobacteria bacterium]